MPSCQCRNSHYKDEMVWRPSHLFERWSHNSLIFIIGIPILVRWCLYIEYAHRSPSLQFWSVLTHWRRDKMPAIFQKSILKIPQCIRQISQNALFSNRNMHTLCTYFCYYNIVYCGMIWGWSIMRFVQQYHWPISLIPQCNCPISHNTPFKTEICTFLIWMVHCGI